MLKGNLQKFVQFDFFVFNSGPLHFLLTEKKVFTKIEQFPRYLICNNRIPLSLLNSHWPLCKDRRLA